jgi:hypothetical protein
VMQRAVVVASPASNQSMERTAAQSVSHFR